VKRLLVAAGVACLAFVAAPAAGAGHTVSGTIVVVGSPQVVSQNGTDCEFFGGAIEGAIARALWRARTRYAATTVTSVVDAGVPCNPSVTVIVVRASLTSSARPRSAASRR
jgi:hypothetical protein